MFDFIIEQLGKPTMLSTLIYLFIASFLGLAIGQIKIFKVKLGIAGTLFVGITLTHFGAQVDTHILHFIREFGLILFVYCIGVEMGPRFLSSFKKDGLTLNLMAATIVLMGFGIALAIYFLTDLTPGQVVGIMCGAVTNTPSLGAAQQILTEQADFLQNNGNLEMAESLRQMSIDSGMAYALAYPFGVIGIILTMLLVRYLCRINVEQECENYKQSLGDSTVKLESVEVTVTNSNLYGKTLSHIAQIMDSELAVSRIFRNGEYIPAKDTEITCEGDVIYGVSSPNCIENLRIKIGDVSIRERQNIQDRLDICDVLITNRKVVGKTIEQVGIYRRYEANITRIYRSGMEILPQKKTTLELGDYVRIVGERKCLSDVRKELGNSQKELAHPNIIPLMIGITLGLLFGMIPIMIPGLPIPAKLGLAGGPLVVSIFLGYKGRIGKLNFYMTPGANMMLKELGIVLFLTSVGLLSGEKFIDTLINRGGAWWMLYGTLITFIPIFVVTMIVRLTRKFNYLKLCGAMSGAMTDPPALEFANSLAPVQAQSTAYAMIYPLTMFLRIILGQVFILITVL